MPFKAGVENPRSKKLTTIEETHEAINVLSNAFHAPVERGAISTERTDDIDRMVTLRAKVHGGSVNIRLTDFDGKHPLYESNGTPTNVVAIANGTKKYNISFPVDAATVACAKDHPVFKNLYTIEDDEEKAVQSMEVTDKFFEAGMLIKGMNDAECFEFSRLFKINPDKRSKERVRSELMDKARFESDEVIKMFNDPLRPIRSLIAKLRQKDIIGKKDNVWKYNDVVLGTTTEEIIAFLDRNDEILDLLTLAAKK